MEILVTGSSGHLGEALVRSLRAAGHRAIGLDLKPSSFTDEVASITDREAVRRRMRGIGAVLHTASLHKPHLATHSRQDFIDVNVTGTLVLLEEALAAGVGAFVYTSTTSAFGSALRPPAGAPAAWITEDAAGIPRNMYGVTKTAAEDLCQIFDGKAAMRCVVLRTSRFFPEEDDRAEIRDGYEEANTKANEFLYRRVEIEDVVSAHVAAIERIASVPFDRYIISATTPFMREDLAELGTDAARVLGRRVPGYEEVYRRRGWRMFPAIDRVYVNERARRVLGWSPRYDFAHVLQSLAAGGDSRSDLARVVGSKGYHDRVFTDGPFPVETS
jgi:UDP-glucose 4-epimerase